MNDAFRIRRGTGADSPRAFDVFLASALDLMVRQGIAWDPDPKALQARLGPLFEHLASHAAEWWVAEDRGTDEVIGYARSVERGGLLELSEFFVHPDRQSAGVGAALLARVFPEGRGEVRAIIATTDVRAQARYYRAGTVARFPIASLEGTPQARVTDTDLEIVR
ncbi:MAG: GNAT family N-acetyltransferase, partial [Chloroflexi bacterium]|nr:GNAT family N-acetyltransferase [Chloroflexota bacterium]